MTLTAAPADVFLNNATLAATGSSGTTAPSSGAVETWSTAALGIVWPELSPIETQSIQDPAHPTEIIRIIESAGSGATSIMVIRGADGTTPIAHGAGATYVCSAVASALNKFAVVNYGSADYWGADPTDTVDSSAAVLAAYNAIGGDAGNGEVELGFGTYWLTEAVLKSPNISFKGPGSWACKIDSHATGAGDTLRMYNPTWNVTDAFSQTFNSGRCDGVTIDGTNAGTAANGLHYGDFMHGSFTDLVIQHFPTGIGLWMDNVVGWCEGMNWRGVLVIDCKVCVQFDVNSGVNMHGGGAYASFAYSDYGQLKVVPLANQDGIVINNGSLVVGDMRVVANCGQSLSGGNTGAMLRIIGNSTGPNGPTYSSFTGSFNFYGETDWDGGLGSTPHQTIWIDTNYQNRFNAVGFLYFINGWTASNWVPGGAGQGTFLFAGFCEGDSNLQGGTFPAFQVIGGFSRGVGTWAQAGSLVVLYTSTGDGFDLGVLTTDITLQISETPKNEVKDISIRYVQASSGGPFTVTYPGSSIVRFVGGPPTASTGAGEMDEVRLHVTSSLPWIGQALLNVT